MLRTLGYNKDRYLTSPFAVMLLHSIVDSIPYQCNTDLKLDISAMNSSRPKRYFQERRPYNNWYPEEDDHRLEFIEVLFREYGESELTLRHNTSSISHARTMELTFVSGEKSIIRFDQCMGYWAMDGYSVFPFDDPVDDQVSWVKGDGVDKRVRNSITFPTYIYINLET